MRHFLTTSLLSTSLLSSVLLAPCAAFARQTPPSVEQIANALARPATPQAIPPQAISPLGATPGNPLQVTAGMLKGPTRGIIPAQANPSAAATLPPAKAAAAPPAANSAANPCPAGSGVCALYIEFETGSASLTTSAVTALDNLGKALASLQASGFRFRVEGHTDTVGSEEFNHALSEQRADTVTTYLARHFSIDRSHLQPVGMGKDHPLVPTPDQTAEPRNRRVQLVNLGA